MFIHKLQLTNFKRFTDLSLDLGDKNYKLVLLIGKNGSGKSSVFDAFEACVLWSTRNYFEKPTLAQITGHNVNEPKLTRIIGIESFDKDYYAKNNKDLSITIEFSNNTKYQLNYSNVQQLELPLNIFYGRTSLRQVPTLTRKGTGQGKSVSSNEDRPNRYIDFDNRFENDIEDIGKQILELIFRGEKTDSFAIREQFIEPINKALNHIFADNTYTIDLLEIIPPLQENYGVITFQKGDSKIHYNLLSNGEKAVFNVLLNLFVRRKYFTDTIYFIDELDLHLNTALQKNLLQEIVEHWLPENCQLWTASHSLGFIEYANETEHSAIIDFDDLNFDLPQVLYPVSKNQFKVFEIAVNQEFITKLFEGKRIIFAENTDVPFYNNLQIQDTVFFRAIDKKDVFFKSRDLEYYGLIDRDYLSIEEISELKKAYPHLFILNYYCFENYLYHPDNLMEYYQSIQKDFDKQHYIEQIIQIKKGEEQNIVLGLDLARRGYPFYKENQYDKQKKEFENKLRVQKIRDILFSDDFETFYQVFSMKDYGKDIVERQNLNKQDLARTHWFKTQIEAILQ